MHRMQSPLRQKAGVVLGLIDFDLFALNLAQHSVWSLYLLALPFLITVGLYYCFNNLSDARIFIIMYGVTSMYFSAVMVRPFFKPQTHQKPLCSVNAKRQHAVSLLHPQVRLMLVLAPVMCILSGIGVSQVLTTYMKNLDVSRPDKKSKKQQDSTYPIKNEVGAQQSCSEHCLFGVNSTCRTQMQPFLKKKKNTILFSVFLVFLGQKLSWNSVQLMKTCS